MSSDVYLNDPTATYDDVEPLFATIIMDNFMRMAAAVDELFYSALWRPGEIGIKTANQLELIVADGIAILKADPEHYKTFSAANGWGTYEQFIPWLENYLEACEKYPLALVSVSRLKGD